MCKLESSLREESKAYSPDSSEGTANLELLIFSSKVEIKVQHQWYCLCRV